jgi:hypothetical protein
MTSHVMTCKSVIVGHYTPVLPFVKDEGENGKNFRTGVRSTGLKGGMACLNHIPAFVAH